jgi:DNA-binding NarL/FixJ family response regulator
MAIERLNIWIIEDNDQYRMALIELLSGSTAYQVNGSFETTEKALKALKINQPPAVILSDISLPGKSGVEALPVIKNLAPDTKIIMVTVHDEDDQIFSAICSGADGYLLKSDGPDQILESIKQVLDGGAPINPRIAHKVLKMFSGFAPTQHNYDLSEREKEILNHIVGGKTKKEIAKALFLSFHTIDFHIRNIYKKLQVHSRSDAVAKALREKLV